MDDDLILIDETENTLPVEELVGEDPEGPSPTEQEEIPFWDGMDEAVPDDSREENLEESIDSPGENTGDELIEEYETTVGYDDTLVMEQLVLMNESLIKLNGLIAALLFFTVATWVLQKVHRGVKEVMYVDRDN